jgi:aminoglycoside phosphotransferase (APT) family kinase protein
VNADQPSVSVATVRELLVRQFPQWAALPVTEGPSAGAGNSRREGTDVVAVAGPAAAVGSTGSRRGGRPDELFQRPWAVFRWLRGASADTGPRVDLADLAVRLGEFVAALRTIDVAGVPASLRPHPLQGDHGHVRSDICALGTVGLVDEMLAAALWDSALAAPPCRISTWIHGDLFPMNLLVDGGELSAVIDFDLMGAGDSAVDMVPAWTSLTAETRPLFRAVAGVDDDTWVRGRGWALKAGLGAVRRYGVGDHPRAGVGRYALSQAIADYGRTS